MKEKIGELRESHEQGVYKEYVAELKLSEEDLHKHILDVGSQAGDFASEAAKRGYRDIVSIDILHPEDQTGGYEFEKPYGAGKFAVADALSLPFEDNEFDLVVSIYAIPVLLDFWKMREEAVHAAREMLRVTKPGGEVRLSGVELRREPRAENDTGDRIALALQDLAKQGIDVSIEEGPDKPDRNSVELAFVRLRK